MFKFIKEIYIHITTFFKNIYDKIIDFKYSKKESKIYSLFARIEKQQELLKALNTKILNYESQLKDKDKIIKLLEKEKKENE